MLRHTVCLIVIITLIIPSTTPQYGDIRNHQGTHQFHGAPDARSSGNFPFFDTPHDDVRSDITQNKEFYHNHEHNHEHNPRHDQGRYQPDNRNQPDSVYGGGGFLDQSHQLPSEPNHSNMNAAPFNLVPDGLRAPQQEFGMDHQTMSDVNISLIHDIFFKNFTKRGSEAYAANTTIPRSDVRNYSTNGTTESSSSCQFGLCEEVDDYPAEKIRRFVSRSQILKQFFEQQPNNNYSISFANRFAEDGDSLCPTIVHTKFPKSAVNINKENKIIVNVDGYKQGVIFETCAKPDGPCNQDLNFPDGYVTTCKQKYAVRRLMAVSVEKNLPVFDDFELPSCCVCLYKKH